MFHPKTHEGRKYSGDGVTVNTLPEGLGAATSTTFTGTPELNKNIQEQHTSFIPSSGLLKSDATDEYVDQELQDSLAGASNQTTTNHGVAVSAAQGNTSSSPIRNRSVKISHTNKSVGEDLKNDVNKHTSDGIPVTEFLRLAFQQDDQHFTEIVTRAGQIINHLTDHVDYKENIDKFKNAISYKEIDANSGAKIARKGRKNELGMYLPLENVANMILEEAERTQPCDGNKIRLWSLREMPLSSAQGQIKPDLVLIPKDTRDRVQAQNGERVDVREVLSVFELKVDKNAAGPKIDSRGGTGSKRSTVREKLNSVASRNSSTLIARGSRGTKRRSEHGSDQNTKRGKMDIHDILSSRSKVLLADGVASDERARGSSNVNDNDAEEDFDKKKAREKSGDASGRMQLARYMTEVLSARGDRKSAYGVRLNAHEMTLAYYHRSGIVETEVFDIFKNPEYFAIFLLMFQRHPSSYGFNTTMGYWDPFNFKDEKTQKMNITRVLMDKSLSDPVYDDLKIEKQEATEFCLVGRGGTVFKAKAPGHEKVPAMAIKFSWQSTNREHEIVHMKKAKDVIPENVAETYGYATIEDDSPIEALIDSCPNKGHYTKVDSRVLVMKHYKRLSEIEDCEIFWELIVQLILCLHKLYSKRKLLHRDISIGNLAYEERNGKYYIIILDFELATEVGTEAHKNEIRTGTAPFMAREVLEGFTKEYKHGLHHDLESVYYVLVWYGAGYRGHKPPGSKKDPLKDWRMGNYETIRAAKMLHMRNFNDPFSSLIPIHDEFMSFQLDNLRRAYMDRFMKRHEQQDIYDNAELAEFVKQKIAEKVPSRALFFLKKEKQKELVERREKNKPTVAISFKQWILSAGIVLDEDSEHLKCDADCCNGFN